MIFMKYIFHHNGTITKLYAKLHKRGRPCGATPLFYHEALPPFDHSDMEEYGR